MIAPIGSGALGSLISSMFGTSAGAGFGGLLSGLGNGIVGKLFGSKKQRIPSGFELGKRQADYFQALYKGQLNPWELAGAGGQGEGGAAAPLMSGLQQRNTNSDQLKNLMALESAKISKDLEVANIQADTQLKTARIQQGDFDPMDDTRAGFDAEASRYAMKLAKMEYNIKNNAIDELKNEFKQTLKTSFAKGKFDENVYGFYPKSKENQIKLSAANKRVKEFEQIDKQLNILGEQLKQAKTETAHKRIILKYLDLAQKVGIGKDIVQSIGTILGGAGFMRMVPRMRDGSIFGKTGSSSPITSQLPRSRPFSN